MPWRNYADTRAFVRGPLFASVLPTLQTANFNYLHDSTSLLYIYQVDRVIDIAPT